MAQWNKERILIEFERLKDKDEYVLGDISHVVNNRTRFEITHKKCGTVTVKSCDKFFGKRQSRCAKCSKRKSRITGSTALQKWELINDKNEYILGDVSHVYGNESKLFVTHKKCGTVFRPSYEGFFGKKQTRCPFCNKPVITPERALYEFNLLTDKDEYELGDTNNIQGHESRLYIRHKLCNTIFTPSYDSFFGKMQSRCPFCSQSKGEKIIAQILTTLGIKFFTQQKFTGNNGYTKCKNSRYLAFDFFIPSYNLVIEFQGAYHFKSIMGSDLKIQQHRDAIKKEWCRSNHVQMLELFDNELKSDSIKEILISYIF